MEKKYYAHFAGTASSTVEFTFDPGDLEGDTLRDALEDAAYKAWPGVSLCHQCAHEVELGEFEIPEDLFAIEEA